VASNADADGRSKNRRVEMSPTPRPSNAPARPRG
jgi:flagellar motor protein MotB